MFKPTFARSQPSERARHDSRRFVALVREAQQKVSLAREAARTRRILAELDERSLQDIGLTRDDLMAYRHRA